MKRAFSLVELIVVVVIIGILAAIAIPRFSRGASGAGDSSVRANLSVLRNAIELYYYEHGEYPGQKAAGGTYGIAGSADAFKNQLTMYSNADGTVATAKDSTYRYGPYLRTGIPPCPVEPRVGKNGVAMVTTTPAYADADAEAGWVFNYETGAICVNSANVDSDNVAYDDY